MHLNAFLNYSQCVYPFILGCLNGTTHMLQVKNIPDALLDQCQRDMFSVSIQKSIHNICRCILWDM